MTESWVVKTELTTQSATMSKIEVFTATARASTESVSASVASALEARNLVATAQAFNPLLLGGC